jgi:hypothetical protein
MGAAGVVAKWQMMTLSADDFEKDSGGREFLSNERDVLLARLIGSFQLATWCPSSPIQSRCPAKPQNQAACRQPKPKAI